MTRQLKQEIKYEKVGKLMRKKRKIVGKVENKKENTNSENKTGREKER